jgi:hypothetical protein
MASIEDDQKLRVEAISEAVRVELAHTGAGDGQATIVARAEAFYEFLAGSAEPDITNWDQIEHIPTETVVRDADDDFFVKSGDDWLGFGRAEPFGHTYPTLPLTILHKIRPLG